MKKKKKLLVLLVALLLFTTGCAKQTASSAPAYSVFCLGTCIGKKNSDHACAWQYLIQQGINQI